MGGHLWAIGTEWIKMKGRLADDLQLSHDALHIHLALLVMFVIARIIRRRPDTLYPFLAVLSLELANEINDVSRLLPRYPEHSFASSMKDLVNTMFWPTVLLCFGRLIFPTSVNRSSIATPDGLPHPKGEVSPAAMDDLNHCNGNTPNLHGTKSVLQQPSDIQ